MQATQQRILEYLAESHTATARELHRILDMTLANIRHHLTKLEHTGQIEVIGQTTPEGRGRPEHIYMLTRSASQSGINTLAETLLDLIKAESNTNKRNKQYERIADSLRADAGEDKGPITIKLSACTQRLNELNYQSHWEAQSEGPLIVLGNCPYAEIIDNHPDLCTVDHILIEQIVGQKVQQEEKISRKIDGSRVCKFRVANQGL